MSSPKLTILYFDETMVARIDLPDHSGSRKRQGPRKQQQFWSSVCTAEFSVSDRIREALELSPERPGRIAIISPCFWTDVLHVPQDVASIASEAEVYQALAIEAESNSGIAAFECMLGAIPLASKDRQASLWLATQVSRAQWSAVSELLRQRNLNLRCVAHPIVGTLAGDQPQESHLVLDALRVWDVWHAQGTPVESNDHEAISSKAEAWAAALERSDVRPLFIRTPGGRSAWCLPAASATLTLLTIVGCLVSNWHCRWQFQTAERSIAQLEQAQSLRDSTLAALKRTSTKLEQLRKEVAEAQSKRQLNERTIQQAESLYARQSGRWSSLIDGLAETAEECWITRMETDAQQTKLFGLALDNAAAHAFAGRLETALRDSGWSLMPTATQLIEERLIGFEIVLVSDPSPPRSGSEAPHVVTNVPGASGLHDQRLGLAGELR